MRRLLVLLLAAAAAKGDDLEREVSDLVEAINRDLAAGAAAPLTGRFDADALADELATQGLPGARIKDLLRRRPDTLAPIDAQLGAESLRLRQVRETATGAIAIVDLRTEGFTSRIRLFLVRRADGWRIGDMDAPELGMRLSTVIGMGVQAALSDPKALAAFLPLGRASAAIQQGDFEEARKLVERAPDGVPPKLDAIRLICLATCLLNASELEEALKVCAEADRKQPDMPITSYLRATALSMLDRDEEALAACRAYVDLVGETAEICSMMGDSLLALDRRAAAAEAYGAALREDPGFEEALVGLARALPPDEKGAIADHFRRMPDPAGSFASIAAELGGPEDLPVLRALIATYAEINPGDPWIDYVAADVLGTEGKPLEAAARLKQALGRVGEDDRDAFLESYYDFVVEGGKALDAYDGATDRAEAFRWLAERADTEVLRVLIERRAGDGDPDAYLHLWRIELASREGRHEDVVQLAAKHAEEIRAAEESARLDSLWIRGFARTGRAKDAVALAERVGDPFLLLIAHAAAGHGMDAIGAFEKCLEEGYDLADLYDDEDLRPLRESEAFEALRAKHPPDEEEEEEGAAGEEDE